MSKFEKFGSITFSPTAVTDKEEVHGLHKRAAGSGVCDWNNMINKPFDVTTEMVEIVPERTLTSVFDAEWKEYRDDYLNFELKVGAKYTVIINEETLIGECYADNEASGAPTLMWGEYKTDKFVNVQTWDANTTSIRWGHYYDSSITLKIIEEVEVVKQIDPKFVGGIVFRSFNYGESFACDTPFNELYELYKNDKPALAKAVLLEEDGDFIHCYVVTEFGYNDNKFVIQFVQINGASYRLQYESSGSVTTSGGGLS